MGKKKLKHKSGILIVFKPEMKAFADPDEHCMLESVSCSDSLSSFYFFPTWGSLL